MVEKNYLKALLRHGSTVNVILFHFFNFNGVVWIFLISKSEFDSSEDVGCEKSIRETWTLKDKLINIWKHSWVHYIWREDFPWEYEWSFKGMDRWVYSKHKMDMIHDTQIYSNVKIWSIKMHIKLTSV